MRFLILVPLLLCCSCAAAADTVRVVKVHDGDTVHCLRGDTVTVNVRLQAFGADGGSQMLADPKPLPPWEWRASERERKAAAVPSGQ